MHHVEGGKLNVYVLRENTRTDIWSNNGPLADEWYHADVEVLLSGSSTKVCASAVGGTKWLGRGGEGSNIDGRPLEQICV